MELDNLLIREAVTKDIDEIVEIFKNEYSKPPYNEKWTFASAKLKIEQYLKFEDKCLIAIFNNRVAGFIIFKSVIWDDGNHIFVDEFAVDERLQKKGIGKKLINFVESYNKNTTSVEFFTHKNSDAYKFYKNMGYNDVEGFTFMAKKLKS
jgi:aminoglycoside 6'-N-acetyltransferase I